MCIHVGSIWQNMQISHWPFTVLHAFLYIDLIPEYDMLLGKISCILLTKASMASSSSRHSLLFVREGRVKWEGLTSRKSKLSYWGPRLCGVSGSGLCTGTMGLSGWLELANLDNKRVCKFKIYTHRISYPHKFIYEKNYKSFSAVIMNDELN